MAENTVEGKTGALFVLIFASVVGPWREQHVLATRHLSDSSHEGRRYNRKWFRSAAAAIFSALSTDFAHDPFFAINDFFTTKETAKYHKRYKAIIIKKMTKKSILRLISGSFHSVY